MLIYNEFAYKFTPPKYYFGASILAQSYINI